MAAFSNILSEMFVPNLVISDFWVSGQPLIKGNFHNSRTIDDIDMQLGLLTKLDRNKTTSKKFDHVMSKNCDAIVIFPIYRQFEAIRKPDSRCIVWNNLYFLLIVTFYLTKTENRAKKSPTLLLHYCFE